MSSQHPWASTLHTYMWVFNTERGFSALIRLPNNLGILYDLGGTEDFSPISFVAEHIAPFLSPAAGSTRTISQCVLSHPHADHIQELPTLLALGQDDPSLQPRLLTCPNDKEAEFEVDFSRLISDENAELIQTYRDAYEERNPPLQTITADPLCNTPNVEYGLYYMPPPSVAELYPEDDQAYCNGLSILLYVRHGPQPILFTGDVTPDVFARIVHGKSPVAKRFSYLSGTPQNTPADFNTHTSTQPTLKAMLAARGLSVLIAPHHGLESCFPDQFFPLVNGKKPHINIISEKRHLSEEDGKVDARYQSKDFAFGADVDNEGVVESRYSVSTRNNQNILVTFDGSNATPGIYLREDPEELLDVQ